MTEDDISRGLTKRGSSAASRSSRRRTRRGSSPSSPLPSGEGGSPELWKLNHYYERLDEWHASHGIAANPFWAPAAEPLFELHNLTQDPEERCNRVEDARSELSRLQGVLETEREAKRLLPAHRNPASETPRRRRSEVS